MTGTFVLRLGLLLMALLGGSAAQAAENGKAVLITGANRGIGLELARQFRERGYAVIATAREPDEAVVLKSLAVRVEQLDVADMASVRALAEKLQGVPIDILVNNAGISGHDAERFEAIDFDAVATTFDVNSLGPMRVTQALLPNLEAGSGRTIVQIGSVVGSIELSRGGLYGYRASKAALNMFNKTLSSELARRGYICVVMHPGWVKTRMGGAGAKVEVEESVAGMLSVIEQLRLGDTGRFLDYTGKELPW